MTEDLSNTDLVRTAKGINARIQVIVEDHSTDENYGYTDSVILVNSLAPREMVDLSYTTDAETAEWEDPNSRDASADIAFPMTCVFPYDYDETKPTETVYGILPETVRCPDGNYYLFLVKYFFDRSGLAYKFLGVQQMTSDTIPVAMVYGPETLSRITTIAFQVSEGDSRNIPMSPDDFQKILLLIDQIDAKQYVKIKR